MKVLFVNSVAERGSTSRIVLQLCRAVTDAGDAGVIAYGRGAASPGARAVRVTKTNEFYLHALSARLFDSSGFASSAAAERLIALIRAERPDVIHLHNLHGYYLEVERLFAFLKSAGLPVVWTLHDCWAFTGHCATVDPAGCPRWPSGCGACPADRRDYPARWLFDASARNFARKQRAFTGVPKLALVTPSRFLAGRAARSFLGGYPCSVIPNGVNRAVFSPAESDLRRRFGLENRKLALGVADFWVPRKGFAEMLQLPALLGPAWRVALVGLSTEQLKSLPGNVLGIPHTKNAAELAAWYSAADVYVNPTKGDTLPTTNLEALCCGTPVVCSDTGGCAETFTPRSGVAVPVGDMDALCAGVFRAASLSRRDCLADAEAFSVEASGAAYLALYARLLAGDAP